MDKSMIASIGVAFALFVVRILQQVCQMKQ